MDMERESEVSTRWCAHDNAATGAPTHPRGQTPHTDTEDRRGMEWHRTERKNRDKKCIDMTKEGEREGGRGHREGDEGERGDREGDEGGRESSAVGCGGVGCGMVWCGAVGCGGVG